MINSQEEAINQIIAAGPVDTNIISDGYHTFGELYDHRAVLYITLCRFIAKAGSGLVWRSFKHSDGSVYNGFFILGIGILPGKQITYHLPEKYLEMTLFASQRTFAPEFDGHSSKDVLERLNNLFL